MFLATEAIGLGGWMHCGILSGEIFEALGFTIIEPQQAGLPNPVGLDRVFQAYCPPYFDSMDAAVDAVLRPLLRKQSTREAADGSPAPYRISGDDHRDAAVAVSEEGIACTKAVCNWHRQLVTSGQLNLGDRQLIEIYCQHTLQISAQISNFWVLEALCSAAVT